MSESPKTTALVKQVLEEQERFEQARATRLGQGAERLTAPIGGLIGKVIPPELVRQGLQLADKAAGYTIPSEVTSHDLDDLEACEAAALRVQGWSVGTNAATGAGAGFFGAAGLTAEIPATISLAARNVRATGAAYGFAGDSEAEATYRLLVLEVATSMAGDRRSETIASLKDLAEVLATPEGQVALEKGGRWVVDKVVERIARQLGISLGAKKTGQVVPVVGGAVAAMVNASFQTDVSRAARYAYRLRWLMGRRMLPAPRNEEEL